jgi:PadR family transcriptional regulator PadR
MRTQAQKEQPDLLLLAIMANDAQHGCAVIDDVRERSDEVFDLPKGTVHPALHRLQKGGHLTSEWNEVQGRRRRTYRLTQSCRSALGEQRMAWNEFTEAMTKVLKGVPGGPAIVLDT